MFLRPFVNPNFHVLILKPFKVLSCTVWFPFSVFTSLSNFLFQWFSGSEPLGVGCESFPSDLGKDTKKSKIINATYEIFPKRCVLPVESIMDLQLKKGENHCFTASNTGARFRITWATWGRSPRRCTVTFEEWNPHVWPSNQKTPIHLCIETALR